MINFIRPRDALAVRAVRDPTQVKLLLDHGADVRARRAQDGASACFIAATVVTTEGEEQDGWAQDVQGEKFSHLDILQALVDHSDVAAIEVPDHTGRRPFVAACEIGQKTKDRANLLLQAGVAPLIEPLESNRDTQAEAPVEPWPEDDLRPRVLKPVKRKVWVGLNMASWLLPHQAAAIKERSLTLQTEREEKIKALIAERDAGKKKKKGGGGSAADGKKGKKKK